MLGDFVGAGCDLTGCVFAGGQVGIFLCGLMGLAGLFVALLGSFVVGFALVGSFVKNFA